MATKKKALQAAAGAAGGEATYVDDVFSTYLYTGDGSSGTITNGIDLDGEGGMVWFKKRNAAGDHYVSDTERGATYTISTNKTNAQVSNEAFVSSFNSDGLDVTSLFSDPSEDYASWTFRKAPGFFDVVTYTGNGTAGNTISSDLIDDIGMAIIKCTSSAGEWIVQHKDLGGNGALRLNLTDAFDTHIAYFNNTAMSGNTVTLGSSGYVNNSGDDYVAYLFADGDDADAQIFGTDGDQAVVKCGSYTGNSSNDGPEIDLGFEPQFLIIKAAQRTANWFLWDTMRGLTVANIANSPLYPNLSNAEYTGTTYVEPTPTGFKITDNSNDVNSSLSGYNQYIYIAIRRPHKPAESGTEVFAIDTGNSTGDGEYPMHRSGFPVDMAFWKDTTGSSSYIGSRLINGNFLSIDTTDAETNNAAWYGWDYNNGWMDYGLTTFPNRYSWMFKRSPGFFDVVCYEGAGSAGRTVDHNLGVAPEMMIVKIRSGSAEWHVYHVGTDNYLSIPAEEWTMYLNTTGTPTTAPNSWNDTAPTATQFTLGTSGVNNSGHDFIAYLFASQDGISKVFSVTKSSGSNADVNCGFSSGARFVMLKRTDSTGDWYVWDTERGIVSGNDPYLLLNSTAAENTSTDYIDPLSTGFTIVDGGLANGDYIGLAIA